jgi:Histone acetyl transferase HAT1 N-terminus
VHLEVRSAEDKASLAEGEEYEGFHSRFTYPVRDASESFDFALNLAVKIFGEEEKIYGYKGLVIDV